MSRDTVRRALYGLAVLMGSAAVAAAGGFRNDPGLVLDTREGSWRLFMGWRVPTLVTDEGETAPLRWPKSIGQTDAERGIVPMHQSWYPPENWKDPDFDDTFWPRTRGRVAVGQPARFSDLWVRGTAAEWNLVLLRGRFYVTDPEKVNMPRIELQYYGGAVVYVNGTEVQRGHLPDGKIDYLTPADPYPKECYVRHDGSIYGYADLRNKDFEERIAKRSRTIPPKVWITAVGIPKDLLRKGVNVIGIEVHTAPLHEVEANGKARAGSWKERPSTWAHAGVIRAVMRVGVPTGLDPNVAPSEGLAASTENPWDSNRAHDFAHPQGTPLPIRLVTGQGGAFSGRVLVSSNDTIWGLKAAPGDLKRVWGSEVIPAAAVKVRYAEPANPATTFRRWPEYDGMLNAAPEEIPAYPFKIHGRKLLPVPTACVPVWATVNVPADAAPGEYRGALTITAEDYDPITVPIHVKVHDYRMPDTRDYLLTHNIYQSPDSVALYYKVPFWSDKHLALVEKSLVLLRRLGTRMLPLPLTVESPNFGNVRSMVLWVRQKDGSFTYDFTGLDKYLDLYAKTIGKPRCIAINTVGQERNGKHTTPLNVTVVDAETGKESLMPQPEVGTPEDVAFWKPVLMALRERFEKRGWQDSAMIRHVSYCWSPTTETMKTIKTIWDDARWSSSCHGYRGTFGKMPVNSTEWVWGNWSLYNPDNPRSHKRSFPRPWKKVRAGRTNTDHCILRDYRDKRPVARFRWLPEATMLMNLSGLGQEGGDFFPIPKPGRGRFRHLCNGAGGLGIPLNCISYLAPGPEGPVPTERAMAFSEGVQMAEVAAWVRKALDDGKAAGDLAKRAEVLLEDRARHFARGTGSTVHAEAFASSGIQVRDDLLLAVAAEIQKAAPKEADAP